MHRVMMVTAYHGVKDPEAVTRYDRVAAVKADQAMLETFWREGCAHADQKMQEWLGGATVRDLECEDHHVELHMPDNYDDSQTASLRQRLEDYVVNLMIARWMAMVWPEQESRYVEEASRALDDVERCLWSRRRQTPWQMAERMKGGDRR